MSLKKKARTVNCTAYMLHQNIYYFISNVYKKAYTNKCKTIQGIS